MTESQAPTATEEARGAGLRVTAVRVAPHETVRDGDHLGFETIAVGVRDRVGHISPQTVYPPGPVLRLFHRSQFLSTVIRLVRKDSHD